MTEMWSPELGDEVWYNYPDHPDPIGKVIGFVPEGEDPFTQRRAGQPIIENYGNYKPSFLGQKLNVPEKVVIHPRFLLPFPYRGEEWLKHEEAGLIQ